MAGNSKKSRKDKGSYARYKSNGTYSKNKVLKLERHLRQFPDDQAAATALAAVRSGAKSPRWGYKGPEKAGSKTDRVVAQIYAALRRVNRVYKTIRSPHTMVIGAQNQIYNALQLKETFGYKQPKSTGNTRSKPVRRGGKKTAAVAA